MGTSDDYLDALRMLNEGLTGETHEAIGAYLAEIEDTDH